MEMKYIEELLVHRGRNKDMHFKIADISINV